MNDANELHRLIEVAFSEASGIPLSCVRSSDFTLAAAIHTAPMLANSIDLLDCFAQTSNKVFNQSGWRIELPAVPLGANLQTIIAGMVESATQTR